MTRPQLDLILTILIMITTAWLLVVAGGAEINRLEIRETAQRARSIEIGAALYAEHCRNCHGAGGEGSGQLGPALNDFLFFERRIDEIGWQSTLEEYVLNTIEMGRLTATRPFYAGDGVVVMTAWSAEYGGPLRSDQVQAVADFVLNWEANAMGEFTPSEIVLPTPARGSSAEQAALGQQVFLARGCADCHTVQGISTGESGPDLTSVAALVVERMDSEEAGEDAVAEYLRNAILIPDLYVVEGYPPSSGCGGILTNAQLDDLVAFLLTLK